MLWFKNLPQQAKISREGIDLTPTFCGELSRWAASLYLAAYAPEVWEIDL